MKTSSRALLSLTLCLALSSAAGAAPQTLRWKLKPGMTLKLRISSKLESGTKAMINTSTSKEMSLEGLFTIETVDAKGQGKGTLRLERLYAIKAPGGSGKRMIQSSLRAFPLPATLGSDGNFQVERRSLAALEAELEGSLEDSALSSHFNNLFFRFPKKPVDGGWAEAQDNIRVAFTISEERAKDGSLRTIVKGKPIATSSSQTVTGTIKLELDPTTGIMTKFEQFLRTGSKSSGIVNSESYRIAKRSISISLGSAAKAAPPATGGAICPKCGKQAGADAKFCPADGTKFDLSKPLCPKCHKTYAKGVKFCPTDGSKLKLAKRRCPKCGKSYESSVKFCPADGSKVD